MSTAVAHRSIAANRTAKAVRILNWIRNASPVTVTAASLERFNDADWEQVAQWAGEIVPSWQTRRAIIALAAAADHVRSQQ